MGGGFEGGKGDWVRSRARWGEREGVANAARFCPLSQYLSFRIFEAELVFVHSFY